MRDLQRRRLFAFIVLNKNLKKKGLRTAADAGQRISAAAGCHLLVCLFLLTQPFTGQITPPHSRTSPLIVRVCRCGCV